MTKFEADEVRKLWRPAEGSYGEDNGQVTIIGGSDLFHGAPIFAVKAASRLADMVFFSSPEPSVGEVALKLKARLNSFIWVPWEEAETYAAKSEAVLIGPGFMRFRSEGANWEERFEKCDEKCRKSMEITRRWLEKFPDKKWVIDGGSLQVMRPEWIPRRAVVTPNRREYELLFNSQFSISNLQIISKKYDCVIVYKAPVSYVSDGEMTYEITGGNAGLTKGGTGDVLAGIIVGLLAKNPPLLAAAAGTYLIKKTAEKLYERVGYGFNADDVSEKVFEVFREEENGN